jgi:hypothetical protein
VGQYSSAQVGQYSLSQPANEAGSLRAKVEDAQTVLTGAIAKANLTGGPLGQALEAMSVSLGAQLALHQANIGHSRDVTERLDVSVVDAIRRGEQALEARRTGIVEALAPELAKQTARSVRAWNRTVTLKIALSYGTFAVSLALGVDLAGYGSGWQAGHTSAMEASGALAGALHQAGPDAEAALVSMVRANNVAEAWVQCRRSATVGKEGRRVCVMPMWAEPEGQPVKG